METEAPLLGEPVAVELMNTIWADRDGVHDALLTGPQARAWLTAIAPRLEQVIPEPPAGTRAPAAAVAAELRLLRDALRRLAADVTTDPRPSAASAVDAVADALDHLNRAAARAPRWASLRWPSRRRAAPARTVHTGATADDALIAQLAEHGIDLFAATDRPALRACLAPGCVLYFVKNHARREWCSAACGNRARVARHYQRHHGDPVST